VPTQQVGMMYLQIIQTGQINLLGIRHGNK
jgi:hypothetical protein